MSEQYLTKHSKFGKINRKGVFVYFIVIMLQIPFVNTELYQGIISLKMNGLDIAWMVGVLCAALFYIGVMWLTKRYLSYEDIKIK